jgi:hypothetical protein
MSNSNTTPEVDGLSDDDFNAMLDALFGGTVAEPEFTEKQGLTVWTGEKSGDGTPVRITVEYMTGHAYEAAQSLSANGSAMAAVSFALAFADETVDAKLAELGLNRESAWERFVPLAPTDDAQQYEQSPSAADGHDPLRILRDDADVDSLLRV